MFLLCIKIFADMFPTIAKSAIAKKLLKTDVPRIFQSLGGLINGLVSCILASYWLYLVLMMRFIYVWNDMND